MMRIPACRWWALAVWMAGLMLAMTLSACDRASAPAFNGVDITGASYAQKLELPDADGRLRRLDEFKGKVVIVFFGFTHCPDVCPTTLSDIAQARQALGADGARVQPIFVTLDPERDTPEVLKAYVQAFGPDVVGLRGDAEQTKAVAQEFKVFYSRVPGKTADSYTLDHTAGAWVFDPQGRVRLFTRHGQPQSALLGDLRRLLAAG